MVSEFGGRGNSHHASHQPPSLASVVAAASASAEAPSTISIGVVSVDYRRHHHPQFPPFLLFISRGGHRRILGGDILTDASSVCWEILSSCQTSSLPPLPDTVRLHNHHYPDMIQHHHDNHHYSTIHLLMLFSEPPSALQPLFSVSSGTTSSSPSPLQ
ncbi:hypothetical protein TYRP_005524 [Tyrophagus putrescentiae]|nr:hypothetical protein TYRP_005524 [Tyrophagus putrescentiae]